MEHTRVLNDASITGEIHASVYDVSDLEDKVPEWNELSKREKYLVTQSAEKTNTVGLTDREQELVGVEPTVFDERAVFNVTTERFHQYFVDNLDPAQTAAKDNLTAAYMALGTDGGSGTAVTDADLNKRVYSETVTDHADNGTELLASTFVDSTEANGYSFDEIGLYTGDPANLSNSDVFLINHATFKPVTKDNTKTVTFDVTLTFSDT